MNRRVPKHISMRAKRPICLLCRHAAQSQTQFTPPRRFAFFPSAEPNVLPRSATDPDKASNPILKKAEDVTAPEETLAGDTFPQDGLEVSFRRVKPKPALHTVNVTPLDLWAYALLGISEFEQNQASSRLLRITSKKGIHPEDSADSVVEELVRHFSLNPRENLRRAGFPRPRENAVSDQIQRVKNFSELRRIISLLSSTEDGCHFLTQHATSVLLAIRVNRKVQNDTHYSEKVPSSKILTMINNLHINFESRGLHIGPQLCSVGLYYASKACNIAAVKMYLQLTRRNNYIPGPKTRMALRSLVKGIAVECGQLKEGARKTEALELITGWRGSDAPPKRELRTTSFAYLSYRDNATEFLQTIYPTYILGLGELGLHQALYAEWTARDPKRMNPMLLGDEHMRFRAQLFAVGFILAKEEQRALQVLASVPISHNDISTPSDTGAMHTRLGRRLTTHPTHPTPNSSSVWVASLIRDHYNFHRCVPTPKLHDHLIEIIPQIPHDPQRAVETLKGLLLLGPDFQPRHIANYRYVRPITWSGEDGHEGIRAVSRSPLFSPPF